MADHDKALLSKGAEACKTPSWNGVRCMFPIYPKLMPSSPTLFWHPADQLIIRPLLAVRSDDRQLEGFDAASGGATGRTVGGGEVVPAVGTRGLTRSAERDRAAVRLRGVSTCRLTSMPELM